jgi:hypothetical protein
MTRVVSALVCIAVAGVGAAWADPAAPALGRDLNPAVTSLLDPGRLSQQSDLSFFYGAGGGLREEYGGLYQSHFTYRFSSPLTLRVSLGARFDGASAGTDGRQGQAFLSGFELAYRPSSNFIIHLNYVDGRALTPASYDPYGYRGSWLHD